MISTTQFSRNGDGTTPALICPNSKQHLSPGENALTTDDGQHTYPLVDDIPIFENLDEFYESRWSETDQSIGNLRNYLVKKQRFFVTFLKGQSGAILDLGCGGGWKLYTKVGNVTGVDLSHGSLKIAKNVYEQVVQANWTKLPFADNSFDIVVSSDVLGHVPYADKSKVWSEIVRILKPGGLTLHYIEANSHDPLMQWCKKYPDLYQKYVIDTEGHIGMESALDTMLRFRNFNLEPLCEKGVYRLLMYLNRVPLLLDNEYKSKSSLVALVVAISKILLSNKITELIANLVLACLMEIADRVLPQDWSNGVLVAYRKPTSA
jgi:ubiquinone/menaquinone biosynthesis C-methylase UbiE